MKWGSPTNLPQAQAGFLPSERRLSLDNRLAAVNDLTWQVEIVDPANSAGESVSLKLDSNDQPHLSYVDQSTRELKYAYRQQGGRWHLETVAGNVYYQTGTSLALDRQGKPHIACFSWSAIAFILARFDGSRWITETVHQARGFYPSLALDSQQRPHLSYDLDGVIWYAYRQQDGWGRRVVESVGIVNVSNSLALDQNDNARISYYFYHSSNL
jgi:hypothetical protein